VSLKLRGINDDVGTRSDTGNGLSLLESLGASIRFEDGLLVADLELQPTARERSEEAPVLRMAS
jgi:hypothetical protein